MQKASMTIENVNKILTPTTLVFCRIFLLEGFSEIVSHRRSMHDVFDQTVALRRIGSIHTFQNAGIKSKEEKGESFVLLPLEQLAQKNNPSINFASSQTKKEKERKIRITKKDENPHTHPTFAPVFFFCHGNSKNVFFVD